MAEEIFDIVNERDEVIGQMPRATVHREGRRHRAVHIFVFNSKGEVFLQKRSMTKDTHPGEWDSSASGHVDSGEDYDPCVVREVREEIGLVLTTPPRRLFKVDACDETGQEFVWVYGCHSEGPFTLHPDEIETGGWFAPHHVTQWMARSPAQFSPALALIWRLWRDHVPTVGDQMFPEITKPGA
jgi:isopentenyl-diphosphate delta-isomerase type 1